MAKTIKFNLICDGKPIRTIEDLQNNFSIEDVLDYYDNKLLHRWLKVRGYEKELAEVNKITENESFEIIKKLISVFHIALNEDEIKENLFILEHLSTKQMFIEEYKKDNYKVNSIVVDYITHYNNQIEHIIENKDNIHQIKAAVSIILEDYYDIFKINYRWLFYKLLKESPTAIFVLLTFEKAREFYIPKYTEEEKLILTNLKKIQNNEEMHLKDCDDMYSQICNLNKSASSILGDNLLQFSGQTDGYWKDLETNDKKYMILGIGIGDYVRSTNHKGGDLGSNDTYNKFVILEGIDYKSNTSQNNITYMEA